MIQSTCPCSFSENCQPSIANDRKDFGAVAMRYSVRKWLSPGALGTQGDFSFSSLIGMRPLWFPVPRSLDYTYSHTRFSMNTDCESRTSQSFWLSGCTHTKYTAGHTDKDKEQRLYWHPNIYNNHTNMDSMNHPILFSWSGLKSSGINTCILWSLWSLVLGLESIQLLVPGSANPAGCRYSDLLFS